MNDDVNMFETTRVMFRCEEEGRSSEADTSVTEDCGVSVDIITVFSSLPSILYTLTVYSHIMMINCKSFYENNLGPIIMNEV